MKDKYVLSCLLFSLLTSILLLSACSSTQSGLAPSNIPLQGARTTYLGHAKKHAYWGGMDFGIIAFPFTKPPVERAKQALLKKYKGDALINISYSTDRIVILFVVINRFAIEADVVRLTRNKGEQ